MCGALGAVVIVLPKFLFGNNAIALLATVLFALCIGLILIVVAFRKARKHGLAVVAMLCIFLLLLWPLVRSSDDLHTSTRWLLTSRSYKADVLKEHAPSDGSLKHVEWDGWGFAGAGDTTVYLVLDPDDRLADAAKSHLAGKFSGIPCEVVNVHRLERSWYTVLFYTDIDWDHCA
jgi:hypothetical protein